VSVITITISVNVPDGSSVSVASGGSKTASSKPFVERPAPPQPEGFCEIHDKEWVLVPAGRSKTKVDENGNPKRYNAFWTCPERGCDNKPPFNRDAPAASAVDELDF
jgi:hypothetical protein